MLVKFKDGNTVEYEDLSGKYFDYADFSNQAVSNIDFSGSTFLCADFNHAKFVGCNFEDAYIREADLSHAILLGCNLSHAKMQRTNLSHATLNGGCNMHYTHLEYAKLECTDLRYSNMSGVYFDEASTINMLVSPWQICPQTGEFTAWKKVYCKTKGTEVVAELRIPANAERITPLGGWRKCRASSAVPVKFYEMNGSPLRKRLCVSGYYTSFEYKIGEEAFPDRFDGDIRSVCSNGIHFFMTKEEAEAY